MYNFVIVLYTVVDHLSTILLFSLTALLKKSRKIVSQVRRALIY